MRINREEVFGPVVNVIRAKDYDEALAIANDSPFGLSAASPPPRSKHATHFKRHAQAGMVMVSVPTAGWTITCLWRAAGARPARAEPLRRRVLHDGETAYTQA